MPGIFTNQQLEEVHLKNAPLVKALAQVRFPVILKLDTPEGIQGFQERLRAQYPVTRQEPHLTMVFGPNGPVPSATQGIVWRMSEVEGPWTVVLARDFVAVETSVYSSRDEFLEKWRVVLDALETLDPAPAVYDRLGVRYVNRLVGDNLIDDLPSLVRTEILGPTNIDRSDAELVASVSQSIFRLNSMQVKAGWGMVPGNTVIVPGIDAVSERSWMLDVDVFSEQPGQSFSTDRVIEETRRGAEHAYAFFRWAVLDEFLRRFGGDV